MKQNALCRTALLWIVTTAALSLSSGCNITRMAVDQTAKVLLRGMPVFEKEWDYEFVEAALPAEIKMIEGLLETSPNNPDLLFLASQAYTAYAMVFLEDRFERAEEMTPEADRAMQRAKEMYMRGHRFGLRLLEQRRHEFRAAFEQGGQVLDQALAACEPEDVPGLFWTAMPLAAAVNLAREDVTMIAQVPRAKALVGRALQLDESYYHAGAHMIYGALYGSVGKMLGGDPEEAKKHFEKALQITGRKFLLVQVMYAKTAAAQLQDRALFDKLLAEVIGASLEVLPEEKLANVSAKRRARRLMARADELF